MNSIFNRKSVRKYKDLVVEDEKIERILRAAMAAPSAGNQQPWEFYVVKNKSLLERSLNLEDTIHPFAIIPIGYPLKEEVSKDRYNEDRIHYIY